jgi:inhibitor of KinA
MKLQYTIEAFGEHAIIINWEKMIDEVLHNEVLKMNYVVTERFKDEIIETVPTYHSLAIYLKNDIETIDFIKKLEREDINKGSKISTKKYVFTSPVCYTNKYGLDIKEVAYKNKISVKELIELHTKPLYKIYFLGFLPGFPYLGGLDSKIHTPRKILPRKIIEKGSVAIGGSQTGIYTVNSPGGWNIIGKTPLDFFTVNKPPYSLFQAGDYIKFKAVTIKEFNRILLAIKKREYKITKEVYND